jgi:Na+-transporting methylmalonyl-CoA/oxaloacetate decarboxylase gamma subunit
MSGVEKSASGVEKSYYLMIMMMVMIMMVVMIMVVLVTYVGKLKARGVRFLKNPKIARKASILKPP